MGFNDIMEICVFAIFIWRIIWLEKKVYNLEFDKEHGDRLEKEMDEWEKSIEEKYKE